MSHPAQIVPLARCEFAALSHGSSNGSRRLHAYANVAFLLRAVIGVWLYAWVSGCATPPNPTAFADASHSLAASVRAVGAEVHDQLEASAATKDDASLFERHWAARNNALKAASCYSQSLVKVFAESHASQPAALSRSLQTLARALGVGGKLDPVSATIIETSSWTGAGQSVEVGAGVLAATADTIAFIQAQIALVHASRTLEEALIRAQPVIERMAALIISDTHDLEKIIRASAVRQRLALTDEFNDALAFSQSLDRRRDEIRRLSYSELRTSDLEELSRIDTLKASVAADLAPYSSSSASINQRESDALDAIRSTRGAIETWADAHRSLAQTASADQPPDTAQLIEAIAQLNTLIVRMRDH